MRLVGGPKNKSNSTSTSTEPRVIVAKPHRSKMPVQPRQPRHRHNHSSAGGSGDGGNAAAASAHLPLPQPIAPRRTKKQQWTNGPSERGNADVETHHRRRYSDNSIQRDATGNAVVAIDKNDNVLPAAVAETDDTTDSNSTTDNEESLRQCKMTKNIFIV